MFKSGSQIVPGEHKCMEKDVLDHSVLCGSQPASWVSTTVSWLLCVVAYWCHFWWHVGFSILHKPEFVSFMVGLIMDTFQRSSIRVPAVMTAVGEGTVNCSELCGELFKSQCGARTGGDTQGYPWSWSKLCWNVSSLFHGVFVATALFLESLFQTSRQKRSPRHFCFIHCSEKIVDCCTSCFYMPCWSLKHLVDSRYLKIPDSTGTGSPEPFIGVSWKGQARKKLEVKEIFDLRLLQQSAAFP